MKRFHIAAITAFIFLFTGCSGVISSIQSFAKEQMGDYHYDQKAYRKAFDSYKYAAQKGSAYAYYRLDTLYTFGLGVPKNKKIANDMLEEAARLGYPTAEVVVANKLIFTTKNKDMERGLKLLYSAASKETPQAYVDLYMVYNYGIGVKANRSKARYYARLAKANGFDISKIANQSKKPSELTAFIQNSLKELGFYSGSVDGVTGPMTKRAIQSFQKYHGYPVDTRISYELFYQLSNEIL